MVHLVERMLYLGCIGRILLILVFNDNDLYKYDWGIITPTWVSIEPPFDNGSVV